MKTRNHILYYCIAILFSSCYAKQKQALRIKEHEVEIQLNNGSRIYADRIANESVLKTTGPAGGPTKFISYKIGFEDSTVLLQSEQRLKKGKYMQYEMYNDWNIVADGDTIVPVFTQPVVKRRAEIDESILVFEVPSAYEADTLLYHDNYTGSGLQKLIVKRK